MEENNPLISVIIPVYNAERFLSEAIDSVQKQSYSPLEIIVIDSSEDNSATIAKSYQNVKYYFQEKCGLPAALNEGVRIASGDFFAFLDADDIWQQHKLEVQMETLRKDPSLDAVFGHHRQFLSMEDSRVKEDQQILPAPFKGAMLIRRESFFRVGLFDTSLTLGDFIDWYKRATENNLSFLMLPDVLLKRRIHNDNLSVRDRHAEQDYVKIMKAALDRARKKQADEKSSRNSETDQEQKA
jgi:glycosyltransferase involved in cell wall biosynthesis